jgi:hypothetical protein
MRIRIIRAPKGQIDGVHLTRFEAGEVYDVNMSIGTYLMVGGYAEAVADTGPARVVPIDPIPEVRRRTQRLTDKAAEIPRTKRSRR